MKNIRDPLYGYIGASSAELRVINQPSVQRLRRVHQLGLSSAVYPGATHTRFEHSLGVMHLAGEFAQSLAISPEDVQAYRLAGLLHDIGHAPFSHATEHIMEEQLGISHEEQSCRLVDTIATDLGDAFPSDPALVKAAIRGESEYDIVAGPIDCDRMDYLCRDAFETGLEHGHVDTETIIKFAEVDDGTLVLSHKSLQALEGLLIARVHMTNSVYQHHASQIVETMLQRAVEDYLDLGRYDAETLLGWDDFTLHAKLSECSSIGGRLYDRISNRQLYKRALVRGLPELDRQALRTFAAELDDERAVEREIAAVAGVPQEAVLISPPVPPSVTDAAVQISWRGTVRPLSEVSPLFETIQDAQWRAVTLGVYAPEDVVDSVRDAAQAVFNIK